jgi:hypothetical protein
MEKKRTAYEHGSYETADSRHYLKISEEYCLVARWSKEATITDCLRKRATEERRENEPSAHVFFAYYQTAYFV